MLQKALFDALVWNRWDVAPKVHSVVEAAHDFDRALRRDPVHQEMASPTAAPRNAERAKACHDLVAGLGARNIRTVGKFANRLNKGVPIDARLSRAKILRGPFEDVGKVDFRSSAETNAPSLLGHRGLFAGSGDELLREIIQVGLQLIDISKFLEVSPIQRRDTGASRCPQGFQSGAGSRERAGRTPGAAQRRSTAGWAKRSVPPFAITMSTGLQTHLLSAKSRHATRGPHCGRHVRYRGLLTGQGTWQYRGE
ncbi:hypothetical protein [Bradyrhizobium sp.]|uniref:hypothetical protein n=1 Tax=Bradyrhizobium sp. TaxID=376 RepID=UPI003C5917F3